MRRHFGGDSRVGFGLKFFVRNLVAAEQQELRAVKPHPLGAAAFDQWQLFHDFDVRGNRQRATINRLGRVSALGIDQTAHPFFFVTQLTIPRERFFSRIKNQLARIAVENRRGERDHVDHRILKTDDRRHTEGPRKNRRVGVDTALLGGKAQYLTAIHRCGVGWRQIISHQDVPTIGPAMTTVTVGRKISQQPLRDILEIGRALAQKRIGNPPHRLEEILHHRIKRILSILPAACDRCQDPLNQRAVFKHHHMSLENAAFVVARKVLKPPLQLDELALGGL